MAFLGFTYAVDEDVRRVAEAGVVANGDTRSAVVDGVLNSVKDAIHGWQVVAEFLRFHTHNLPPRQKTSLKEVLGQVYLLGHSQQRR